MRTLIGKPLAALGFGLLLGIAGMHLLYAQQGGLKRTVLQDGDTADIAGHKVVMALIEAPAGADIARHTHPGTEISYILDGSGTLTVDGEPPREIKAGDSFMVPAGRPHGGKSGPNGIKLVGVYVVEKDKPLASPAPK
ncbi:MAG TPA: cupin domain-containing protein [Stellaceae bacterium]|nr:cupin domain-containing protein [Stellaceae bacterium]